MPNILDELINLTPQCDQPLLASRGFVYRTMYDIVRMDGSDRQLADFIAAQFAFRDATYEGEGEHAAAWRVGDFLEGGTAWRME